MNIRSLISLITVLVGLNPLFGANEKISCTARVALNRVYMATVDEATREMKITSDTGAAWEGIGSFYRSSSGRTRTYYIPLFVPYAGNNNYFPTGMAIDIDSQSNEMALCLRSSECYLCARN